MTDYTELVKALRDTYFGDTCVYCEHSDMCKDDDCIILQAAAAIKALQAEVKELKRVNLEIFEDLPKLGEWINSKERMRPDMCSVCGCVYEADRLMDKIAWNYCPNCGAKMREVPE